MTTGVVVAAREGRRRPKQQQQHRPPSLLGKVSPSFVLLILLATWNIANYASKVDCVYPVHYNEVLSNEEIHDNDGRPFYQYLSRFNWTNHWSHDDWQSFWAGLYDFLYQEPLLPINATCRAPDLLNDKKIRCEDYPHAKFAGRRQEPAKIGHALQLGFDVDVLELHLNEIADVVDKIFLIEWTQPHNQLFAPKRLTWDAVRMQRRFRKFQDKVVHFVLDDLDTVQSSTVGKSSVFSRENYQERLRWQRIQQWNQHTQFFGLNDVIGFGDADEIASRENLLLLKHCAFEQPIDIGIWFPFGNVEYAFRTDHPVPPRYYYALGDPTYWPWTAAEASNTSKRGFPSRNRGTSEAYLLGGMHASQYGYLPALVAKRLSGSEFGPAAANETWTKLAEAFRKGRLGDLQDKWSKPAEDLQERWKKRSDLPDRQLEGVVYLPWFYRCNRDRYPRWEWKPDSRLGRLNIESRR